MDRSRPHTSAMTPSMPKYQSLHLTHPSDSEDFFSSNPRNRLPSLPRASPDNRDLDEINLAVLQRYLPSAISIEGKASYAVVYMWDDESRTDGWEKTGVEGTVFVLRLLFHNLFEYAMIVLNRRGLDNWVLYLERPEKVELTDEYIILQGTREHEGKAYGLWIFESAHRSARGCKEILGTCIMECAASAEIMNAIHDKDLQNTFDKWDFRPGGIHKPLPGQRDLLAGIDTGGRVLLPHQANFLRQMIFEEESTAW